MKLDTPFVAKMYKKYMHLCNQRKHVVFCWLPSHIGIEGNEKADSAAKTAQELNISNVKVPYTDYKCIIQEHVKKGMAITLG